MVSSGNGMRRLARNVLLCKGDANDGFQWERNEAVGMERATLARFMPTMVSSGNGMRRLVWLLLLCKGDANDGFQWERNEAVGMAVATLQGRCHEDYSGAGTILEMACILQA